MIDLEDKYHSQFEFLAKSESTGLLVASPDEEKLLDFINDFLPIFSIPDEEGNYTVICLQKNTQELRQKIESVNEKYKDKIPQLNGLPAYFRKLKDDEHFYILPNYEFDQVDRYKLIAHLQALHEGINTDSFIEVPQEIEEFLKTYTIFTYGYKRRYIGEPKKELRVCRFCDNTSVPLSFNYAHAISEGLGNKTLILFDECESCNSRFAKTIEPDIINYLSLMRRTFRVKGKGGEKEFDGQNFESRIEDDKLVLAVKTTVPGIEAGFPLEMKEPVVSQNIYKSLCKFFLSVIDESQLANFKSTIAWINGEIEIDKLPLIAETISYQSFSEQPTLTTYLRNNEDHSLPFAIGEFSFTCWKMVFIVPSNGIDPKTFINPEDFDKYWSFFKPYHRSINWAFNDFSTNTPRKLTMNLKIQVRNNSNYSIKTVLKKLVKWLKRSFKVVKKFFFNIFDHG